MTSFRDPNINDFATTVIVSAKDDDDRVWTSIVFEDETIEDFVRVVVDPDGEQFEFRDDPVPELVNEFAIWTDELFS